MISLSAPQYEDLARGCEIVEADGFGPKVLRCPDGTMLKLFRRKRLLSSALLFPYARRFADNCRRLTELGVPSPTILALYRVAAIERDVVHYSPLPGNTVRQLIREGLAPGQEDALRTDLGQFVARLHGSGILFRSLHLGNVVLTPSGTLGLIDVGDMGIRRGPLGESAILRNFDHLGRYPDEWAWLERNSLFAHRYLECSRLTPRTREAARAYLTAVSPTKAPREP
ncbi:MAG: toluene tolerance protein [Dechloromonas sp.]|nr:toluene tolerance protein [Dechloromonas sp.]